MIAALVAGEADPCAQGATCTGSSTDTSGPLVNVGTPGCDSESECASGDRCLSPVCDTGACSTAETTTCALEPGQDPQCHAAYCDPESGDGALDSLDGASCDDGDGATCEDVCSAGVCGGSATACGAGTCVDPETCTQDGDCCSGKCRAKGRWANTCYRPQGAG